MGRRWKVKARWIEWAEQCSRSSRLTSAFERTLKQHLVSYRNATSLPDTHFDFVSTTTVLARNTFVFISTYKTFNWETARIQSSLQPVYLCSYSVNAKGVWLISSVRLSETLPEFLSFHRLKRLQTSATGGQFSDKFRRKKSRITTSTYRVWFLASTYPKLCQSEWNFAD